MRKLIAANSGSELLPIILDLTRTSDLRRQLRGHRCINIIEPPKLDRAGSNAYMNNSMRVSAAAQARPMVDSSR